MIISMAAVQTTAPRRSTGPAPLADAQQSPPAYGFGGAVSRRVVVAPTDTAIGDAGQELLCDIVDLASQNASGVVRQNLGLMQLAGGPAGSQLQLAVDQLHRSTDLADMLKLTGAASGMLKLVPDEQGGAVISAVIGGAGLISGLAYKTISPAEAGFGAAKLALNAAGLVASHFGMPNVEKGAEIAAVLIQVGKTAYLLRETLHRHP